jgi:hypothetical protein
MTSGALEVLRDLRGFERVTTRCPFCKFVVVAPLEQAHAAFGAYRCGRPRPKTTARSRSGFSLR